MLGAIWKWLTGSDDGEDRRFVPSQLDASVREAHGGNSAEAEREIAMIQQQADELEQFQRED